MKTKGSYRQQAMVFKALANETRLKIVVRLGRGQCQVGELARSLGATQPTISKHLAILRNVGVVEDDRRGNTVFYRLLTPCILDFFTCVSEVLKRRR